MKLITPVWSAQHTDNITGDNITGFTIGSDANDPSDNLSGIGRVPSFWSILDNETNDNVSSYTSNNYSATADTSNISYTLTQGGTTTLNIWVKDAAGNIASKYSESIVLDNESPTASGALSFTGASISGSRTSSATVTLDNSTVLFGDGDGVGVYRLYFTDNSSAAPTDNNSSTWNRIPNETG